MIGDAGSARMRRLVQVLANWGDTGALSRRARGTMAEPARG
jgi:hypothetical protein